MTEQPCSEWISVEDKLPKPMVLVAVLVPRRFRSLSLSWLREGGEWWGPFPEGESVKYWMPLPDLPEGWGDECKEAEAEQARKDELPRLSVLKQGLRMMIAEMDQSITQQPLRKELKRLVGDD